MLLVVGIEKNNYLKKDVDIYNNRKKTGEID